MLCSKMWHPTHWLYTKGGFKLTGKLTFFQTSVWSMYNYAKSLLEAILKGNVACLLRFFCIHVVRACQPFFKTTALLFLIE